MKIIDLLNKIANDEGVPIKIKYGRKIYEYQENSYDYLHLVENNGTMLFLMTELFNSSDNVLDILNEEVEEVPLIEEEKKIPKKIEYIVTDENGEFSINGFTFDYEQKMEIINTLNQVIDYLQSKGDE